MKLFWALAGIAFLVLSVSVVWMGGLNQDEGWYLYAAQMVADGKMPYRDFFYTQGPLLPVVYSAFCRVWRCWGLLGARVLNLAVGTLGILLAVALARKVVRPDLRSAAGLMVALLLGSNVYHLYYLAIPKTYALAALFVLSGFLVLACAIERCEALLAVSGVLLALAAGTRISLGVVLAVVGLWLLWRRQWRAAVWFGLGGALGLAAVYGPFLADPAARAGLFAAQKYHAARSGFDVMWVVGSLSRLVRWYLPVFILIGLWMFSKPSANGKACAASPTVPIGLSFLAVFVMQMLAPFPYEDYQVPIMGLLAVYAVAKILETDVERLPQKALLVLGMTWACSFGSPLLEKWSTNGQDRFWSLKKPKSELAQLREVAREINAMDPGGTTLLTQDLYLAVETGRRVPHGLEMGPFSMLTDTEWRALLHGSVCEIAALSGYSFAINPPTCEERPIPVQMEYWSILKRNYKLVLREEMFGQNQTTLLVLKKKRQ